jgi:glycosyltransferase involved in cell wall biosynthesis
MTTILILIGGHLCTAPRPQKEAETLAQDGHTVVVQGVWFDPILAKRDRTLMAHSSFQFEPVLDFRPGRLERWGVRLQARLAREAFTRWGHFSPALLGYGAKAMLRSAWQKKADLTIVHSEAGLWVGHQLAQRGLRIGVDFEDWFSHDLLPEAQTSRPIDHLKHFEQQLMHHSAYCLTTSHALANTLSQTYQAPKPIVVYNTFPTPSITSPRPPRSRPKLHWFSQTIGPGRGLELLCQALPLVTAPVEIHLRGACSSVHRQWLDSLLSDEWRSRLFIHPTVSNDELPACIAQHDIGLALEQSDPPSRNLTITNKLFQYMQAGLAIIATDTAGQREVFAQCPTIGRLIAADDANALAQAIESLVLHPSTLQAAQAAALQAAQTHFDWATQRDRIRQAIQQADG